MYPLCLTTPQLIAVRNFHWKEQEGGNAYSGGDSCEEGGRAAVSSVKKEMINISSEADGGGCGEDFWKEGNSHLGERERKQLLGNFNHWHKISQPGGAGFL